MTYPENLEPEDDGNGADSCRSRDWTAGSLIDKRYELNSLLGAGACGSVYKARDILLDRSVVAKILHKHLVANPEALERFRKEAITTTALSHHGIIRVYSHGVAGDGRPYMIMDYLEGKNLAETLRAEGRLSLERFLNLFLQVCEALSYAHERGVVHRDVKPSNIIVVKEEGSERAVIVDFGIARVLNQAGDQSSTQTGVLLGSSAYMSPEQCRGVSVDCRSDIYSLGCVMFESLVGNAPFAGESQLDVMYKHLNESAGKLGRLSELPEALGGLLRKCLEKMPESRYQTLAELKTDLLKCVEMQDTIKRRLAQSGRRLKTGWRIAAVVVGSLFLAAAWFCLYRFRPEAAVQKTEAPKPANQAETMNLPQGEKAVAELVDSYSMAGKNEECLTICRRWEKKFMGGKMVSAAARGKVLQTIAEMLRRRRNFDEALAYFDRAAAVDSTMETQLFVASRKADIYREQLRPDRGVKDVESVLHRVNLVCKHRLACLGVLGDCYFDTGNIEKAAAYYLAAVKLCSEMEGACDTETTGYRLKALPALSKLGRTSEFNALFNDCLKSANPCLDEKVMRRTEMQKRAQYLLFHRRTGPVVMQNAVRPPMDVSLDSPAAVPVLDSLRGVFMDRVDLNGYKKYSDLLVINFMKAGRKAEALRVMGEEAHQLHQHGDNAGAVKMAGEILKVTDEADLVSRLNWLVFLASVQTYGLHKLAPAKDVEEQGYQLVQKQIEKDSDFLIRQPTVPIPTLLRCMMDNTLIVPEELDKRIDWSIKKCREHDCENLRHLNFLKVDRLAKLKQLDEALAICQKNQDFFRRLKPAEPVFLYDWLEKEGQILRARRNNEESLQAYLMSLKVAEELPPSASSHAKRRDALGNAAGVLWSLSRIEEARKYFEDMEKEIGPDTLTVYKIGYAGTSTGLFQFGRFCVRLKDYERAAAIYERVERAIRYKLGDDCPELRPVWYLQAEMLRQQNRTAEAAKLYGRVVTASRKYGIEDNFYTGSRQALELKGKG
jgi:serine/threonine protein kinase/tetratricopeptide (TPR) repeat protein